jgi:hypothetical protein
MAERTYVDEIIFDKKAVVDFTIKYTDGWGKENERFLVKSIPHEINENTIIDGDDIIVSDDELHIVLDYPLKHTVDRIFVKKNGFTKKDVLIAIFRAYVEIYDEEEGFVKSVRISDVKPHCNLMTRMTEPGRHGIWGHSLTDLIIVGFAYIEGHSNYIVPCVRT